MPDQIFTEFISLNEQYLGEYLAVFGVFNKKNSRFREERIKSKKEESNFQHPKLSICSIVRSCIHRSPRNNRFPSRKICTVAKKSPNRLSNVEGNERHESNSNRIGRNKVDSPSDLSFYFRINIFWIIRIRRSLAGFSKIIEYDWLIKRIKTCFDRRSF